MHISNTAHRCVVIGKKNKLNIQHFTTNRIKLRMKLDMAGEHGHSIQCISTDNRHLMSSAVRRIYLFHPRQDQHHFSAIIWVYLMRIRRVGPNWIVFKIDGL